MGQLEPVQQTETHVEEDPNRGRRKEGEDGEGEAGPGHTFPGHPHFLALPRSYRNHPNGEFPLCGYKWNNCLGGGYGVRCSVED